MPELNLKSIAEEMRAYAIANPIDPLKALDDPVNAILPYSRKIEHEGETIRVQFTLDIISEATRCLHMSVALIRGNHAYPVSESVVRQILNAFFPNEETVRLPGITQQWGRILANDQQGKVAL